MNNEENLLISDIARNMILVFDKKGNFKKNIILNGGGILATSRPDGNLLVLEVAAMSETGQQLYSLKLVDENFNDLKIIDKYSWEWPKAKEFRASPPLFCWTANSDYIYVAKEDSGYEICVYDSKEKLSRKIRQEYQKIPVSEEYKAKLLLPFPESLRAFAIFPKYHPPFQSLVAGGNRILLVYAFEKGNNPDEFIGDIFNQNGLFIDRMSLNIFANEGFLWARIKSNKFYYIKEKEGAYKELVACDIRRN